MRKAEWIVGIRCDVENVSWRFKVQIKDQNELLTLFWYSWMEWYMEMSTCHCTGVKSIKQWSVLNKTAEGMEHRPANVQLTAIISRGLRPVKIKPVTSNSLQCDEENNWYTIQEWYEVKMWVQDVLLTKLVIS